MKGNIHDPKLQHDMYLYKAKETFTSLSKVNDALFTLKFISPLFDQVDQLVRTMAMKEQAIYVL